MTTKNSEDSLVEMWIQRIVADGKEMRPPIKYTDENLSDLRQGYRAGYRAAKHESFKEHQG